MYFPLITRVVILYVLIGYSIANAQNYYVALNGSDTNNGSQATPWRTLAKANGMLTAGDTVFIRAGTYPENIVPVNTGNNGAPITYVNFPGEVANVVGSDNLSPVVAIEAKEYIIIDGLKLRLKALGRTGNIVNILITGGGNNVIRNCTVVNTGDYIADRAGGFRETGISITNASVRNEIAFNKISGMSLHAVSMGSLSKFNHIHHNDLRKNIMNSITIGVKSNEIQGHLIEKNILGDSYISDGIQATSNYDAPDPALDTSNRGVIVRNNIIRNNGENAIDLKGASNWVIEGNIIFGSTGDNDGPEAGQTYGSGGLSIHVGSTNIAKDLIIRHNIIFDGSGGILGVSGSKIYNNTISNNVRAFDGPNNTYRVGDGDWVTKNMSPIFVGMQSIHPVDLSFINNIVGSHNYEVMVPVWELASFEVNNNIYFNSWKTSVVAVPHFIRLRADGWDLLNFLEWKTWLRSANVIGGDAKSRVVNTKLFSVVDERIVSDNYRFEDSVTQLTEQSIDSVLLKYKNLFIIKDENVPFVIDSGKYLTRASTGGTNARLLTVSDAKFFFDGFGRVKGDRIIIGANNPVGIVGINYASNTITLEKPTTWNNGDNVSLVYSGSAPDIGAIEFGVIPPGGLGMEIIPQ